MSTIAEMLPQIKTRSQDFTWLARHAEALYDYIKRGLRFPPHVNDAMEALILTFPYLLTRADLNRWSLLLHDALTTAQLLQDNELQMQIWTRLGQSYIRYARHKLAGVAFNTALERAEEAQALEIMLEAYIGLLRIQAIHYNDRFTPELIGSVLALAQHTSPDLQASLYQALALVYTHRGETCTALGYGQAAYAYWHARNNALEMAETARLLAKTYRVMENVPLAETFLSLAETLFTQTDHFYQYALITYERGTLYLERRKYEAAAQWLSLAIAEFQQFDKHYFIAMTHHALALAQMKLEQFSEAEANLIFAMRVWTQLDNYFEQANVCHALGFMERERGNPIKALRWLKEGLKTCEQIPQMASREALEERLQQEMALAQEQTTDRPIEEG